MIEMSMDDFTYWLTDTRAGWLDQPVMLHSSREVTCEMTPEQCAFKFQRWLFWYEADLQYGLTVIAFMLAVTAFFSLGALGDLAMPSSVRSGGVYRKVQSRTRFLAYKHFKIGFLNWYSPSLGVILTGALGFVFFMALMLGKQPYYWPNTAELNYGDSPPIATRSGWMSIALLPFVLALAAKENPVTMLTRVAYEKLNVFHRWISWAMYVLALVHTFPFIVYHRKQGDMGMNWGTSVFYWTGVIALAAQSWLMFMSIGVLRNRFYEFFKACHLLMAAIFFIFLFIHCDFRLTSWDYLIAAAVIYALCVGASFLRTYFEYGPTPLKAQIEALPHDTVKVTIPTTSGWAPGQHIFMRFLNLDVHSFTAHPFTIASLPHDPAHALHTRNDDAHQDTPSGFPTHEMSFYIHARGGFTGRLAKLARQSSAQTRVLLDGPYGGMKDRSLASFDRAVIIAGGAGAGFVLPVLEDILRKQTAERKTDTRVVLATKSKGQAAWFRETVAGIMGRYEAAGAGAKVEVFLTRQSDDASGAASAKDGAESSDGVERDVEKTPVPRQRSLSSRREEGEGGVALRNARPDVTGVVKEATSGFEGRVGIAVCGPEGMLFEVRNAAAAEQGRVGNGIGEVYLYSECFGW